jgi:hypothetical protein
VWARGVLGGRGVLGSRCVLGGGVGGVLLIGVLGLSFVLDISDETVLVVSGVGHNLDTAVGKVDTVRSLEVAISVLGLGLVEAGARVFIIDTVLVGEGLGSELLLFVWGGGVIRSGGWAIRSRGWAVRSSWVRSSWVRSWVGVGVGSMVWTGNGNGHKGGENASLKKKNVCLMYI